MRLLEGPGLGHSMIYYDGKLEKKRRKKKKSPVPRGIQTLNLIIMRQVLYLCIQPRAT